MGRSEEDEYREVEILKRIKEAFFEGHSAALFDYPVKDAWEDYLRDRGREVDPTID